MSLTPDGIINSPTIHFQKKPDILMTVASFFRKYSVGCILNYVRLIITREISCIYIYTVAPASSALRSVRSQHKRTMKIYN
jgi:hypothetical protein